MKRNRHHHIDAVFIPKKSEGPQKKFTERSDQLKFASIFITMDNLRKYLLVYQRSTGDSKFFWWCAAIAAGVIQPMSAFKRHPAAAAQWRFNRDQSFKAVPTQIFREQLVDLNLDGWTQTSFPWKPIKKTLRRLKEVAADQTFRRENRLVEDLVNFFQYRGHDRSHMLNPRLQNHPVLFLWSQCS